jgi:putative polyhydroxyalkanoate system protein
MATIDIKRSHSLPKDEARQKAEELAKNLETKIGITWRWEGDAVKFEAKSGAAKGVSGQVSVSDTEVRVEVELPFLLRVLKGTIEGRINEKLAQLV